MDFSQRYYAAWWLGKMRARESVPALLIALQNREDRTDLGGYPLRRNAARALGKLGDTSAIPLLVDALNCTDFYVREAAAQAIEKITASSPEAGYLAQVAIAPLLDLLDSGSEPLTSLSQPYEAILEAIGRLKALIARERVASFLEHSLPRIRFAAARAMFGITQDAQYAELLVAGLQNPDINLRRTVLTDLGEIGYLPAAAAIASCQTENSFKLFALKRILDIHLSPEIAAKTNLSPALQQVMGYMDDLL